MFNTTRIIQFPLNQFQLKKFIMLKGIGLSKSTLLLIVLAVISIQLNATIRYAKPTSSGLADGSSWANATSDLQLLINNSVSTDQIWMAAGTYKPNRRADATGTITLNNRNNAFVLKSGVKIYGGFVGTETILSQRDFTANIVFLSGDIGTAGVTTDNCYHVVISAGNSSTTLLDGITIQSGIADGVVLVTPSITVNTRIVNPRSGAGLFSIFSSAEFRDCTVRRCDAVNLGGGVYDSASLLACNYTSCKILQCTAADGAGIYLSNSVAQVEYCTFTQNSASSEGGGMYITPATNSYLHDNTITLNDAATGGGLYNRSVNNTDILSCIFSGNEATGAGGGIYNSNAITQFGNCIISGNKSGTNGGGLWNTGSTITISNTTISGNRALSSGGGFGLSTATQFLFNSIVWANTAVGVGTNSYFTTGSTITANYNIFEGGITGTGNINLDPLFITSISASSAPTTSGNFRLQKCSPAINKGDNSNIHSLIDYDLDANLRIIMNIVDMGPYEITLEDVFTITYNASGIVFVDSTKSGTGNSWANAYPNLSEVLFVAKYNSAIKEIWVAKGTYFPNYSAAISPCETQNQASSFSLVNNIKLYGGFAGGETDTAGRNFVINKTILSGDINVKGNKSDNCYNVLENINTTGLPEINGFIISEGNVGTGAGMFNQNAPLLVNHCNFLNNSGNTGGALNIENSTVNINQCNFSDNTGTTGGALTALNSTITVNQSLFLNNSANSGGAVFISNSIVTLNYCTVDSNHAVTTGGAIAITNSSTPTINYCSFSSNNAPAGGGAIGINNSPSIYINNSYFTNNSTNGQGGGIESNSADVILTQTVFTKNTATNGGAVHIESNTTSSKIDRCSFTGNLTVNLGGAVCSHAHNLVTNSLFSGNKSIDGSAIHFSNNASYNVSNCTIAGNNATTANTIAVDGGLLNIFSSIIYGNLAPNGIFRGGVNASDNCIEGAVYPGGNINAAPLFKNSISALAAPNSDGDYRLDKCSPCINTGALLSLMNGKNKDLDNYTRVGLGQIDMGAYEYTLASPDKNGIIYVDSSKNGIGDSWANAVTEFADALHTARFDTSVHEIWVAKGNYFPKYYAQDGFSKTICITTPNPPQYSFVLPKNVKIYGGFAGGENDLSLRNHSINKTILNGNNETDYITTDDAYNVVVSIGDVGTTELNGFEIINGKAILPLVSETINSITISRGKGGGIQFINSSPKIIYCNISKNTSYTGGAISITNGYPSFTNCIFSGNESSTWGIITANTCLSSFINFYNCLITGNKSNNSLIESINSKIKFTNATIANNYLTAVTPYFIDIGTSNLNPDFYLNNCIIWGNTFTPDLYVSTSFGNSVASNNSILPSYIPAGQIFGSGNIISNTPQFVTPLPLSSTPKIGGDYHVQPCSVALNMGDSLLIPNEVNSDLEINPRIKYYNVDIGAYEMQNIDTVLYRWNANKNNFWKEPLNWCGSKVPTATKDVVIPNISLIKNPQLSSLDSFEVHHITIDSGAILLINHSTAKLKINGNFNNNGTLVNSGSFELAGNELNQNFPGINGAVDHNNNLEINNPNGVVFNKSFKITGTLKPTNGTITVLNDTITLASTSTKTANVATVQPGASIVHSGTGRFTVERYHPARRAWRLMTSPLYGTETIFKNWQNNGVYQVGKGLLITGPTPTGAAGNGLDSSAQNSFSLKTGVPLVGVGNTKIPLSNNTGTGADNIGYFLFVRGDRNPLNTTIPNTNNTTIKSIGKLQIGDQQFTASANAGGFTLIGNPFACAVNFASLTKNNLVNRFYAWDPQLNSVGGYVVVEKLSAGLPYSTVPASPGAQDSIIQSSQAVYVQTLANGAASLLFKEDHKATTQNIGVFRPYGINQTPSFIKTNLFIVNPDTSILADGNIAVFNDEFNDSVDIEDAIKLSNINETFGLVRNGKSLAIERKKLDPANDTVFFKLTKTTIQNYLLEIECAGLPNCTPYLEDVYLHNSQLLTAPGTTAINFSINSDTASANPNRFRIVFKQVPTLPVTITSIKAWKQNKDIAVEWKVENQLNIREYIIEKSTDGRHFSPVGTQVASGNPTGTMAYNFVDEQPFTGNNYYRIRCNSNSGFIQYSKIVLVNTDKNQSVIVYPNPVVNGTISLQMNEMPTGKYAYNLLNETGQLLLKGSFNHDVSELNETIKPENKLPQGMYELVLFDDHRNKYILKLMIQ